MRSLNSLSDSRQACLLPNPNSKSSVVLGRSFSVTQSGLCVSVLWNTLDTTVSIQRGRKLGYALPMRNNYEETPNLKIFHVRKGLSLSCRSKFDLKKDFNEMRSG